jgi:Na+-translocating ferredoxin:NAD+ oxidoreductase RnfC subunit
MEQEALIRRVREAGVVGEGGAGFPAHVKYGARVDTVIANGCECEPLLYTDQVLMQRHAAEIVKALEALVSAAGASRGVVVVKRKYTEAAAAFSKHLKGGLELVALDNFYPAGDEFILVQEITGRVIPPLGLPPDVGVLVANVGTLYSVHNAVEGQPVTRRMLTVTGEVARPAVLRVPIGTAVSECIESCGGAAVENPVVVLGGPMMGRFLDSGESLDQAVVSKTVGGVVVLPRGHYLHQMATLSLSAMQKRAAVACIQCRYCTDQCPRFLLGHGFSTHEVMRAFSGGVDAAMGAMQAVMCCECGVCELFSCPMQLSPRRINAALKARFKVAGVFYGGPRQVHPEQTTLRAYRKVPVSRLAYKLGISGYMDLHPEFAGDYLPRSVRIPLRQHIGAEALPLVKAGDAVRQGDCIGEIPEGALGARVHASVGGVVTAVGSAVVIRGE